jgi:predicted nucleic acid-binding protein
MNIFLDTSSLFKLYHIEPGSEDLDNFFTSNQVQCILMSEITVIEFASTVWKKVRVGDLDINKALQLLEIFDEDFQKYNFIPIDEPLIKEALRLLNHYGKQGLRTLDSIQLASAYVVNRQIEYAITHDNLLNGFFKALNIKTL